jgi:hypothetical protein
LRLELELQLSTNNQKLTLEKQNDYSVISLFSEVDRGGIKYIDWEILMRFMLDQADAHPKHQPTQKRMFGLMRRLKMSVSSKLSFAEFA